MLFLNFRNWCVYFFCGLQIVSLRGFAQDQIEALQPISTASDIKLLFKKQALQTNGSGQPRGKGELSCVEIELDQKKTMCRYLPIYESASNLQAGILRVFFGGRQPSNPDEAYVRVLNNGQLEFSHVKADYIQKIIQLLPTLDVLDVYVERRKVNIQVQILQIAEGADVNAGFLAGAQYAGKDHQLNTTTETDRVSTSTKGGMINFNFGFGNLVNSILNVTLNNYKANNDIKVISSVPIMLVHGYQLENVTPYSKPIYVQTTSVSAVPEQEGIRFEGQARFYENANSKIVIKDFAISVAQYDPNTVQRANIVEGLETFKSPVRDLELEVGCSTAIRVINVNRKVKHKERNWLFGSKTEENDSKKVFLFVIQAVSDSKGTPPSTTCEHTSAVPEGVANKSE